MTTPGLFYAKTTLTAFALAMLLGCTQTTQETTQDVSAFSYDAEAFPDAKPWSSENFKNNPKNFQFVIIGDRTGGANALGSFDLALDQINLLQPEFVINVGDLIEGYPVDEDDSRPEPPDEIMEGLKEYTRLQIEDPAAAKEMLKQFMAEPWVLQAHHFTTMDREMWITLCGQP